MPLDFEESDIHEHYKLWETCRKFIQEQRIYSNEVIGQSDRVIINAYDLIEAICEIVGYEEWPEDWKD